jgi:hypothetical protein
MAQEYGLLAGVCVRATHCHRRSGAGKGRASPLGSLGSPHARDSEVWTTLGELVSVVSKFAV